MTENHTPPPHPTKQTKPSKPPVSREDVQTAVAQLSHGDYFATNASAIRTFLQRGSNTTIQRRLDALREDVLQTSQIQAPEGLPPMPATEMQALWQTAAAMAQKASYERLVVLQKERDDAITRLTTLDADFTSMLQRSDVLEDELENLHAACTEAHQQANEAQTLALEQTQTLKTAHDVQVNILNDTIAKLQSDLAAQEHAHAMARIGIEAERTTLERVIAQQSFHMAQLQKLLDQVSPKSAHASNAGH